MKLIRWLALTLCGERIFTADEVSAIVRKRLKHGEPHTSHSA